MRILPAVLSVMLATAFSAVAAPSEAFPLWPDKAPDALGDKDATTSQP
jgi:hypothetical protein